MNSSIHLSRSRLLTGQFQRLFVVRNRFLFVFTQTLDVEHNLSRFGKQKRLAGNGTGGLLEVYNNQAGARRMLVRLQ